MAAASADLDWALAQIDDEDARVATVLLPKDWLRFELSGGGLAGERAMDASDASGTLWLDVARRRWSPEALALTGLTEGVKTYYVRQVDAAGNVGPVLDDRARFGSRKLVHQSAPAAVRCHQSRCIGE